MSSEAVTTRRYCEDCVFFQRSTDTLAPRDAVKFGRCGNSAAQEKPDQYRFVSSAFDKPALNQYASLFREYGECGPDAKLFQIKSDEQVAA